MTRKALTFDDAGAIAIRLPGVTEGASYRTRGWKVGRKFLMREKEGMERVLVRAHRTRLAVARYNEVDRRLRALNRASHSFSSS